MFSPNGIITLTTDFGLADAYVAIMKGVILGIAPGATIVDYTHGIAPGAIPQAAYLLHSGFHYFAPGTIHVAVVDPGVGSERRALAIETPEAVFVGPDNGVFGPLVDDARRRGDDIRIVELTEARFRLPQVSATFHGRDIFAPAAAHIVSGVPVAALGRSLETIVDGVLPASSFDGTALHGTIVHVDRFGNCITNITREQLTRYGLGRRIIIETAGRQVPGLFNTYAECPPGVPASMIGSSQRLELAVANASAAEVLGVGIGTPVIART